MKQLELMIMLEMCLTRLTLLHLMEQGIGIGVTRLSSGFTSHLMILATGSGVTGNSGGFLILLQS